MIDMNRIVVFRDGISLDRGTDDCNEDLLSIVGRMCDIGRSYGLSLDGFGIADNMISFDWRGTKRDLLQYYTYYSEHFTGESEETRIKTRMIILDK